MLFSVGYIVYYRYSGDSPFHEIEILMNTVNMYSSYGRPIIESPSHEMGRIRIYRCIKRKFFVYVESR